MKLVSKLACLRDQHRPVLLAAGFFDGVHRGHQAIIRKIVGAARREHGAAWVMTFDKHPLKVLHPESAPRLLTSTPHKLRLLKDLGVHGCIVIPFTRALARREPKAFIAMLARAAPTLRQIVIGRNWTFGRQGRGTPVMLKALAPDYGFKITVIPPVRWHGAVISSTRIRAAVLAGRLAEAAGMLGRPFSLLGTVVPGRGLGRELGIPTANLNPHNEVLPPDGVYIVQARWDGVTYPGIANLGVRPTITLLRSGSYGGQALLRPRGFHLRQGFGGQVVGQALLRPRGFPLREAASAGQVGGQARLRQGFGGQARLCQSAVACPAKRSGAGGSVLCRLSSGVCPLDRVLELHIFDLRRNLYGKAIEVTFLKRLRRERVFPSLEALKLQIRKDIDRAEAWFERKRSGVRLKT